jgi:hypothetical protein
MTSHLLDSHNPAEIVNVTRQSLGHPHVRIEKFELFDGNLLTLRTNDLPVMAVNPEPCLPKIQVPDPSPLLAVDPSGLSPTDMADGMKSFVRYCLQVTLPGIGGYPLPDNTNSRKREIMCYTHCGHRWSPLDVDLEMLYLYYPLEIPDVRFLFQAFYFSLSLN